MAAWSVKLWQKSLDLLFYDKELIDIAAQKENIPFDLLAKVDEKRGSQWRFSHWPWTSDGQRFSLYSHEWCALWSSAKRLFWMLLRKKIVWSLADVPITSSTINAWAYLSMHHLSIVYRLSSSVRDGKKKVHRSWLRKWIKERRTYYEYFTDKKWKDISQYHLAFDSSKFEQDKIIQMIKMAL